MSSIYKTPDGLAAAPVTSETVRCPTCKAQQEWSESCRRCKCDLTLLRDVALAYQRARRRCLASLSARQYGRALRHAIRCHTLRPCPRTSRLVATCHFLRGDWKNAVAMARLSDRLELR